MRFYLLSCLAISLVLPFNQISIPVKLPFNAIEKQIPFVKSEPIVENNIENAQESIVSNNGVIHENQAFIGNTKTYLQIIKTIYLIICSFLLIRILISIVKIYYYLSKSALRKEGKFTIVYFDKSIIPFSFFRYIFIDKSVPEHELQQIIEHEKVHASQFHSIDLLITEIFVALFWFNPFAWMIKKALQQVHEYLADEGVLKSGYSKLAYQALLVNQASEDRLVSVSSNFSYSIIKKRIQMMSIAKPKNRVWIKTLLIFPVAIVFFMSAASFSSSIVSNVLGKEIDILKIKPIQKSEIIELDSISEENSRDSSTTLVNEFKDTIPNDNLVAVASPEKMNVLYIGVDNPVSIAVGGVPSEKVTANISGGTIIGENGNYIVRVATMAGPKVKLTIYVDGKQVSVKEFRVKNVPDPMPRIKGYESNTEFTKEDLIEAGGIEAFISNSDFDLNMEVVGFNLSARVGAGFAEDARSNGATFTEQQTNLIRQSVKKVYIEDVMARSPDGTIRNIGSISITIK
jgi:beta-lactamase regulating signal transducer with metallopeptidase domain